MERRRIHLVLQERLRPHEVPGRQAGDDGDDDVDNRGRNTGGGGRVGVWWLSFGCSGAASVGSPGAGREIFQSHEEVIWPDKIACGHSDHDDAAVAAN